MVCPYELYVDFDYRVTVRSDWPKRTLQYKDIKIYRHCWKSHLFMAFLPGETFKILSKVLFMLMSNFPREEEALLSCITAETSGREGPSTCAPGKDRSECKCASSVVSTVGGGGLAWGSAGLALMVRGAGEGKQVPTPWTNTRLAHVHLQKFLAISLLYEWLLPIFVDQEIVKYKLKS